MTVEQGCSCTRSTTTRFHPGALERPGGRKGKTGTFSSRALGAARLDNENPP